MPSAAFQTELAQGRRWLRAGDATQAAAAFRRAAALEPQAVDARVSLATAFRRAGQMQGAERAARAALALDPGHATAFYELALALHAQGEVASAAAMLGEACARQPAWAEAHYARGVALFGLGQAEEAVKAFRKALEVQPHYPAAQTNLGRTLRLLGLFHEAEAAFAAAVETSPGSAEAHYDLGIVRQDLGRMGTAAVSLRQAIALKPDYAEAHFSLALQTPSADRSCAADTSLADLQRQIEDGDEKPPEVRSAFLFAMAKLLEDRDDHDGAFACLEEANRLSRELPDASGAPPVGRLTQIARVFDRSLMERLAGSGVRTRRPIFVVGMPRSGTTLVEQIIGAHPQVAGAGELPILGEIADRSRGANGAVFPFWAPALTPETCTAIGRAYLDRLPQLAGPARVTDKGNFNFALLGLIHLCLPDAAIIHCQRDPRDVGLSCFATRFGNGIRFTSDLAELGAYWRAYDELMNHWRTVLPPGRILDVSYETMVEDVEVSARRIMAHCDLDWDDSCLRFYEADRPVLTASVVQVRRPIYNSSVGRWRQFKSHLGPLLTALREPWAGSNDELQERGSRGTHGSP